LFGLTSQTRRASASIGANLAEGRARGRDTEFSRFLLIAIGSAGELENQLILARDLGYLDQEQFGIPNMQLNEIGRMLVALLDRVRGIRSVKNEEVIVAK
jgi:four helix bundle protein